MIASLGSDYWDIVQAQWHFMVNWWWIYVVIIAIVACAALIVSRGR